MVVKIDDKQLNEFLDIITDAWCTMDFRTFDNTVFTLAYDPLVAQSWTKRVLKMIDDCKKAGLTPHEIASLFPNPGEIRGTAPFELVAANYSETPKRNMEDIFHFFNTLLRVLCKEDPYAKAKNIVHSKSEVIELAKPLMPADPKIAKTLGRMVSACYHLGHAMYSDMHPSIIYENYGPYDVGDIYGPGHILVVKEFKNLRAPQLWAETKNMPCDSIVAVYVYKNVKLRIDAATHAIFDGDLINNLKFYSLQIDKKNFDIGKLNPISEKIEKMASKIFQKFQDLDFEERKKTYYHQKAYTYKKLYDRLGQDWRPSKEILDEAKGKELHKINWPDNLTEQKKICKNILDPRLIFKAKN